MECLPLPQKFIGVFFDETLNVTQFRGS